VASPAAPAPSMPSIARRPTGAPPVLGCGFGFSAMVGTPSDTCELGDAPQASVTGLTGDDAGMGVSELSTANV